MNTQTKRDYINLLQSSLVAIQEVWQHATDIDNEWNVIDLITRTNKRGGGTALIAQKSNLFSVQKVVNVNKDTNLVKLRIKNNYLWICNLYFHKAEISKIQKLFGKVMQSVPRHELTQLIIVGDFNIDLNKPDENNLVLLQKCSKELGLAIHRPDQKIGRAHV